MEIITSLVIENPRQAILKYVSEWKTDLIMLSSRGRSIIERLLIGSTAQAVLPQAHCSGEIVRTAMATKKAAG
jgi:nucleotide-binding universal stress UspA family protein